MKAVAVSKFGALPQVMELPKPVPRDGMLLIRVAAAGINPFDWKLIDGILDGKMHHQFPLIMGVDGAGVVEAIGDGVTRFKVGDHIYGQFLHAPVGEGAFAEYAIVPEKAAIALAPEEISLIEAAAVPTAGMTALQLLETLELKAGQTLLIIGATGGVGSFASQLAKQQGIHVIATVSDETAAYRMLKLGATETINYKEAPIAAQISTLYPHGVNGLIDLVSDAATFNAMSGLVKSGGAALTTLFTANSQQLSQKNIRGGNFETKGSTASLDKLTAIINTGKLRIPVENKISLAEVPAAIAASRTGKGKGKTVIVL